MSSSEEDRGSLLRARLWIVLAYALATLAGYATIRLAPSDDPLLLGLAADCVGTVVVFAFSVAFGNSSFYDPYWSVAPPLLGAYWLTTADANADATRQLLAMLLCSAWAIRLTYNWTRGWTGLGHEDWRYVDIAKKTGKLYWPVSFLGIHFFPTFQVFAGCVGLYVALSVGGRAFGALDVVAALVTMAAIVIETVADEQLRSFAQRPDRPAGSVMMEGLWAYSRHPNYFGEMSFWWGIFLFGLAADPTRLGWMLVGPLAISVMFFFVSVPMMEKRQLARKPAFAEHVRTTSMILPWFPKRS